MPKIDWPNELTTERLVLRPWRETDAEALFAYSQDPEVGPACGWQPHKSIEESRRILADVLMVPETYAIVIRDREPADEAVGSISLDVGGAVGGGVDFPIGENEASLGFWLGRPLWGHGYMPEAVAELMRHGFEDLGLEAIWSGHYADNLKSRRVHEKSGFLPHHVEYGVHPPQLLDEKTLDILQLTREEWETARTADPTDVETVARQAGEARDIVEDMPRVAWLRSGGQTGADRAGLDAGRALGIRICGWCPKGGLAEDMPSSPGLLAEYPKLIEGPSEDYVERTAWNVRDAHATLIVAPAGLEPGSGTEMTKLFADALGRPCLVVEGPEDADEVRAWLESLGHGVTLNVAGPRESKCPGTYHATYELLVSVLG